jgi:hypothetical protein
VLSPRSRSNQTNSFGTIPFLSSESAIFHTRFPPLIFESFAFHHWIQGILLFHADAYENLVILSLESCMSRKQ